MSFVFWLVLAVGVALLSGCNGSKQEPPETKMSVDQLVTYKGSDRQEVLRRLAEQEGQVVVYNSNNAIIAAAKEFGREFPSIKVNTLLQGLAETESRLRAEVKSGNVQADVFGGSDRVMSILSDGGGLFREFWSPSLAGTVYTKGPNGGAMFARERTSYGGLGYNTNLVKDPPRSMDDLLADQWKGRITLTLDDVTVDWIGAVLNVRSEDYLARLATQNVGLQSVAASALTDLIASGQFQMFPVSAISDVARLKGAGAPIGWQPIEASVSRRGSSALVNGAPHPAAALFFLDWLLGPEGQTFVTSQGYISARSDVKQPDIGDVDLAKAEKEAFPIDQMSGKEYESENVRWRGLLKKYFVGG
jgi:iron(III) transport system substrate-binding protein